MILHLLPANGRVWPSPGFSANHHTPTALNILQMLCFTLLSVAYAPPTPLYSYVL